MDTSKEYIKMCGSAEEIQDYFGKEVNRYGKTIYCFQQIGESPVGEIIVKVCYQDWFSGIDKNRKMTWLPSQDHLQEICKGETIFEALNDFYLFVFTNTYKGGKVFKSHEVVQFATAEQLWLAFLMHSTLQKRWNGENWVK